MVLLNYFSVVSAVFVELIVLKSSKIKFSYQKDEDKCDLRKKIKLTTFHVHKANVFNCWIVSLRMESLNDIRIEMRLYFFLGEFS